MAIFGFTVACGLMLYFSLTWMFIAFFTLSKYNIGGVENTFTSKLITWAFFFALIGLWKFVFENAPFSITIN